MVQAFVNLAFTAEAVINQDCLRSWDVVGSIDDATIELGTACNVVEREPNLVGNT